MESQGSWLDGWGSLPIKRAGSLHCKTKFHARSQQDILWKKAQSDLPLHCSEGHCGVKEQALPG